MRDGSIIHFILQPFSLSIIIQRLTLTNLLSHRVPQHLYLHKSTNNEPPTSLVDKSDKQFFTPLSSAQHQSLQDSNCLFFIRYTPEDTTTSC